MYVPEIAQCSTALSDSLRYRSHLSDHDTELAIITAAREMDCDYVWSGHSQAALKAGVRPEAIDVVAKRGGLEGLTREEAVIVRFGREVVGDHKLSQAAFDAALEQFGEANTVVLGALMGHYTMMSCTLIATDYRPAPGAAVLPPRA
jgi:4-carboxymuconolactone decarboxylase